MTSEDECIAYKWYEKYSLKTKFVKKHKNNCELCYKITIEPNSTNKVHQLWSEDDFASLDINSF